MFDNTVNDVSTLPTWPGLGFGGVLASDSACVLCHPTIAGSKYLFIQCHQVQINQKRA